MRLVTCGPGSGRAGGGGGTLRPSVPQSPSSRWCLASALFASFVKPLDHLGITVVAEQRSYGVHGADLRPLVFGQLEVDDVQVLLHAFPVDGQIGRASCRERVCQYV